MSTNYSEGGETSAIATALEWVSSLLIGQVAISLAGLAIAALGFSMLSGRLPVRRGMTVLVGCFVMFGAPSIASGLLDGARAADRAPHPQADIVERPEALPPPPQAQPVEDP
jgi:type IV secretory pathway VirB2 component (pilin)